MTYLLVGQASEGCAFGQLATNESIAILVGAPLVGGVRSDEVDGCRDRCYFSILSRIHEVTEEAKATGMNRAQINAAVRKSVNLGGGP